MPINWIELEAQMADDELIEPDELIPLVYDAEKTVENAIRAYDQSFGSGNALLIGWVIVAEWIDPNGEPNLSAFAREGMPYWRINALLDSAPYEIVYADDDED